MRPVTTFKTLNVTGAIISCLMTGKEIDSQHNIHPTVKHW